MNKSWLWVLLVLSLGINVGILATIGVSRLKGPSRFEDRPIPQLSTGNGPEQRVSPPIERMADALRLDGELRTEFIAGQREFFESMITQRRELGEIRRSLRTEMMADNPDGERINGLLAQVGVAHTNLDRLMVDNVLRNRELLDPDQQQRYFHLLRRVREAISEGERRGRERAPGRDRLSRDPNERRRPRDRPPPG